MKEKRKGIIIGILIITIMALSSVGIYYWYENNYYVSTEDARVGADLVNVTPQATGKLLELNVEDGDTVSKDTILACQEVNNIQDADIEQALIRAPINGIVIKKQGTIGEIWSPGQVLVTLLDTNRLYITANIEETKIGRVRVGQIVNITLDQYGSKKFKGKIKSVGEAANSALSLLPSSTGGTFTKVMQRVPVKISLDKNDSKLLPGTNAIVKIHVK